MRGPTLCWAVAALAAVDSQQTGSQCVFTQTCVSSPFDPVCRPTELVAAPQPLVAATFACPAYANASCCNSIQNDALNQNFLTLASAYGSDAQGNGACVANIEAMWCAFTCAPDQGRFVDTTGNATMPPPFGLPHEVLLTTYHIARDWACGIFESCRLTPLVSMFGLADCNAFLEFFSDQAIPSGSYTTFTLTDAADPRAESRPLYDCCSYPSSLDNSTQPGNISSIPTSCAGLSGGADVCYTTGRAASPIANATSDWPAGNAVADDDTPVLFGFEWLPVAALYGLLAAGSAAILLGRSLGQRYCKRPQATAPRRQTIFSMPIWGGGSSGAAGALPGAGPLSPPAGGELLSVGLLSHVDGAPQSNVAAK